MKKQNKNAGLSRNKKEKVTEEKNNNTICENKPENTGEIMKVKDISTKAMHTKQDIPKQ